MNPWCVRSIVFLSFQRIFVRRSGPSAIRVRVGCLVRHAMLRSEKAASNILLDRHNLLPTALAGGLAGVAVSTRVASSTPQPA
jgi:hypothetical protein